ncbi:hypothetical protein KY332_00835 [Candidatus Woesearchaeota archaeon]|nr:hypothetical protein [Candidatus Woesearchaeota archaeon]
MTNKLIKDMDEETWRRFIAFCKLKNIKANDQLKEILEIFLEKNLNNLLKGKKSSLRTRKGVKKKT